jgi:hypothetical protein
MGCDSLSSSDDTCTTIASAKVGKFGDKLMGFSGSWEGLRILEIAKRYPELPLTDILFKAGKFEDDDLSMLCIERRKLFVILSARQVMESSKRSGVAYEAAGSGTAHALGSLYSWHDGRDALLSSLKAAAAHNPFVRAPFKIISL